MKLLLSLLLFLSPLLTGCSGGTGTTPATIDKMADGESACVQPSSDGSQQAALLTDASDIYRICSQRPQRLIHSQTPNQKRSSGKSNGYVHVNTHSSHKKFFSSQSRMETAPFCFAASRQYYIIALRRILR